MTDAFHVWLQETGAAAARRLRGMHGGLEAVRTRLEAFTGGRHLTLSPVQLEVMMLIAFGVVTMRDLAAVRGRGSTNGSNDILVALERRGLAVRPRHLVGTRAPWELTGLGWRVLGPCEHIAAELAIGLVVEAGGRFTLRDGAATTGPLCYCPWCGWRLW